MKKVFAVNTGYYSDHRIEAIFTTIEKAKEYMKAVLDNDDYIKMF